MIGIRSIPRHGETARLPLGLEPLLHKLLDGIHNPHQLVLTIRRTPAPDPGIINLALERRIRPLVLGGREDRDDVFVRHEDERLKRGVCSRPGEEVGVSVDHFVIEFVIPAQAVQCQ